MSVSEIDKCYLCDLLGDFDEFQDIKKQFDAQHACWKKYKCDICDKKHNSKEELKNHEKDHSSKSDVQDKNPIPKIIDLNIAKNAKSVELKINNGVQNLKITSQPNIHQRENDKNATEDSNSIMNKQNDDLKIGKSISHSGHLKNYMVHEDNKDYKW